jgi:hypothetical protein
MTPRTPPTSTAETQLAVEELKRYGARQEYKPSIAAVLAYWREVRRKGLPEGEPDRETVITQRGNLCREWRVYVVTQDSIRLGVSESLNGARLQLMLLVPVKDMTVYQAVSESCNRL